MTTNPSRKKQAKNLRLFRKVHRTTGVLLFLFFFIIAVSGILLGWKNASNGFILPVSKNGTTTELKEWLPLDSLHSKACAILKDSVSPNISLTLNRIDVRKSKGMVKFVFENHYWEVQLDGATGKLLQLNLRKSDFIENLHDGSIIDIFFGTVNKPFKVIYTSLMGSSLLLFTVTGIWLWYGPKRMKKSLR